MRLKVITCAALAVALLASASLALAADMRDIPMSAARWPTKAALLEATRQGEFSGIANLPAGFDEELAPLVLSVKAVLHADYGVPELPDWKGSCGSEFTQGIARIFKSIARVNAQTLSETPPDFSREVGDSELNGIRDSLNQLQRPGGWCDGMVMGKPKVHPYKAAAAQVAQEFYSAMWAWAEAERSRRKAAYAEDQRQRKLDADERAARRRALDQRQIDTERARIEAEEKRRQQAKKPQVGG